MLFVAFGSSACTFTPLGTLIPFALSKGLDCEICWCWLVYVLLKMICATFIEKPLRDYSLFCSRLLKQLLLSL